MDTTQPTQAEPKKRLSLSPVLGKQGLFTGIKSDGVPYTVRRDRHRYFFPEEWTKFIAVIRDEKKFIFETLLHTGARIEECLNLRVKDFDTERNNVMLHVTKSKAKKGQSKEVGGMPRGFGMSTDYMKKLKRYISVNKLQHEDYLFVKPPVGFESLDRVTKKKFFAANKTAVQQVLKRGLKRAGLNPWEFSLHNIRKTHGMWLKAAIPYTREITESEICMRLGHDMNTYIKHYGSPSRFNDRDKNMIIKLLGDVYGLK
jgi:integrase